jgi:hypothetical protein
MTYRIVHGPATPMSFNTAAAGINLDRATVPSELHAQCLTCRQAQPVARYQARQVADSFAVTRASVERNRD